MMKTNPATGRTGILLLNVMAILSGGCALAYEVLLMRALPLVCGDMFYVHAALLSTFLIGMGIGARLAYRCMRGLWLIEILTGFYAILLPFLLKALSSLQVMSGIASSPLHIVLVTVALVAMPGILTGFSIPLFSAYLKERAAGILSFQGIYIVYNLGACVSIFLVEFLLVRYCGIRLSLAVTGGVNILNGIILFIMRAAPPKAPVEMPRSFPVRVIAALAIGSFCSSVLQMFFLKLSNLVFHPHRENFALALSIILLGMFLGALGATKIKLSFENILIACSLAVGLIYINYCGIAALYREALMWASSSEILIIANKFVFGCIFALLPMTLFGALIPALMNSEQEVAGESGYLLFVSSLANAAGYLFYVFLGHPFFSTGIVLAMIAVLLLVAALINLRFAPARYQTALALFSLILMAVLVVRWQDVYFYLPDRVNRLTSRDRITTFKRGAESATLIEDPERARISYNGYPSLTIWINGKISYAEMETGIITGLNAPRLDRVLCMGIGTGITASSAAQIFKSADLVEINGAFFDMMPVLSKVNMDVLHNPSASFHLADARVFLQGKEAVYDAIINSTSPTYYAAFKIYTVDFYHLVRKALKPDGVFSLWFSALDMSEEGVMMILSALRKEFRYCELRLLRGMYYQATCSNQPIRTRRFSELSFNGPLREALQSSLDYFDLDELFDDIRLSDDIFEHFTPRVARENTDDRPALEFELIRSYETQTMGADPFLREQEMLNIDPVRRNEIKDPARFARRALVYSTLSSRYFHKNFEPLLKENWILAAHFMLLKAQMLQKLGDARAALVLTEKMLNEYPAFAEGHDYFGTLLQAQGRRQDALAHYRKALELKPDFPEARRNLDSLLKPAHKQSRGGPLRFPG